MKKNLLFTIFLLATAVLSAQNLVSGSMDIINNTSGYPQDAYLIEADASSFYRISGVYSDNLDHPLLTEVTTDFMSIYFIKYDSDGKALKANIINGTDYPEYAASFQGGMTVMGRANDQVETDGFTIDLIGDQVEFIATFDADCKLKKLLNIWSLTADQYVYSDAIMDPKDGSIYIYGEADEALELLSYGKVGQDFSSSDYFYLIKYNSNLDLQWVYTFGYDTGQSGDYPYLIDVHPVPGNNGEILLTGIYGSESSPQINGIPLAPYASDYGTFAVLLNNSGKPSWLQSGRLKNPNGGYGDGNGIFKGFPMPGGGFVLAGNTSTGYYKLGTAEFAFSETFSSNQFVIRIDQEGNLLWKRGIESMGPIIGGGKKGVSSEQLERNIHFDAILWNSKILYMTAPFQNTAFSLGRILPKVNYMGLYIAGFNIDDGEVLWGYGMSSDDIEIYGFDADRSGNVAIMGYNTTSQAMEDLDVVLPAATSFLFHLGLDFNGKPLWYNNVSLAVDGYGLSGSDLEVLPNGEVFTSLYLNITDNFLNVGGVSIPIPSRSSWMVGLTPNMLLGGTVKDESGNPINPGYVRAVKMAPWGSYPSVDSAQIQVNGSYQFTSLYPGLYTLQAIPDPAQYPDAIPTYYGNWITWQDVTFNDIDIDFDMSNLDIVVEQVPKLTSEDGSGNMSGSLTYEEEDALKSTMARPVKKAGVILLKKSKKSTMAGELVAYLETDEFGMFVFDNVPNGDYMLLVDIPGLEMLETHEVSILENSIISGLDYTVSEEGIHAIPLTSGISFLENETLKIYPNPGPGLILMDMPAAGEYAVSIYSTDGRRVLNRSISSVGGASSMNISGEPDGIYLISVEGPETSTSVKYIKR